MRKNKPEIPHELLPFKTRPYPSSIFAFGKDMTLVSYSPKRNKAVLVLSTLHDDDSVDPTCEKPDIVLFYNSTKGALIQWIKCVAIILYREELKGGR